MKETQMKIVDDKSRKMMYKFLEFWMMFSIYVDDERIYRNKRSEVQDYYEDDPDINVFINSMEASIVNSSKFNYFLKVAKKVENLHIPYLKYSCNPYA